MLTINPKYCSNDDVILLILLCYTTTVILMLSFDLFRAAIMVSKRRRRSGLGVQLQPVVGGRDRRTAGQFRVRAAVRVAIPRIARRHGPQDEHPSQR